MMVMTTSLTEVSVALATAFTSASGNSVFAYARAADFAVLLKRVRRAVKGRDAIRGLRFSDWAPRSITPVPMLTTSEGSLAKLFRTPCSRCICETLGRERRGRSPFSEAIQGPASLLLRGESLRKL